MSEEQILIEKVIAAALGVAAGRAHRDTREPGPYDDAQAELDWEILENALGEFVVWAAS